MIADLLDPAGFMVSGGVMGFWLAAPRAIAELLSPAATRPRPPRHARPRGYQGPPNRAPFPIVTEWPPDTKIMVQLIRHPYTPALSPLNRDVLRGMMRRDLAEAHGRRLV